MLFGSEARDSNVNEGRGIMKNVISGKLSLAGGRGHINGCGAIKLSVVLHQKRHHALNTSVLTIYRATRDPPIDHDGAKTQTQQTRVQETSRKPAGNRKFCSTGENNRHILPLTCSTGGGRTSCWSDFMFGDFSPALESELSQHNRNYE